MKNKFFKLFYLIKKYSLKLYSRFKEFESEYDVREVYLSQYSDGIFNRLDIVVRLLAIDEFFGKNNFGYDLYIKMQIARKSISKEQAMQRLLNFKNHITSYQKNGYEKKSKILLNNELSLCDGSHRIAMNLYFKEYLINSHIKQINKRIYFGEDWFIANGFNDLELNQINSKHNEILKEINIPFICILWPSVYRFHDEIELSLSKNYKINSSVNIDHKNGLSKIISGVYSIDNIESWKVLKKIENIIPYNKFPTRYLELKLKVPKFRVKSRSNSLISTEVEKIKKIYRRSYMNKIENYFFDNVIHIGDNFSHTFHMREIRDFNLDISSLLKSLSKYEYALLKTDTELFNEINFPKQLPFSKDLDIICHKSEVNLIINSVLEFLKSTKYSALIEHRILKDNYQIRIEKNGFLLFLFDISYNIRGISDALYSELIKNRIFDQKGFYKLEIKHECLVRANEFLVSPRKTHHLEYLKVNCKKSNGIKNFLKDYFKGDRIIQEKLNL